VPNGVQFVRHIPVASEELSVEIFKQVSINWLGKRWWFFGFSFLMIVLGVVGYMMHGGLEYGIDFTGGTLITLKFNSTPDLELLRKTLKPEAATPPLIQRYGPASENEVQIRMQTVLGTEKDLESGRGQLLTLLRKAFDPEHVNSAQADFNNIGQDALYKDLLSSDPDNLKSQNKTTQEIDTYYKNLAQTLLDYRNTVGKGLVPSLGDLKNAPGVSAAVVAALSKDLYAGPFAIKGHESVGAVVGSDLRHRAQLAVGLSFLGMLVYVGFRFKPIYGVAAVIAVIHDIAITIGLFAVTHKEISLTVIAALLTLVGYSMNDTIVVFDRVRENLRIMRKETLYKILDLSINQTLSRTIMTSGMTFLSVFALFVFGGEVLNGFSFALTVGIIIGTYSSIGIASPIVEWWYRSIEQKSKRKAA
jgi:preprotein translocase subunit SecF